MFDFDVRGFGDLSEEPHNQIGRQDDGQNVFGLGTVHLGAAVGDVPRGPAVVVPPELSVGGAIEALRRHHRGTAVVARDQRPLGLVTDRDLFLHADGRDVALASVMTACEEPLRTTDTVGNSLRRMCATGQWHLPIVCARGLLLGSIDIADLMLWLRDRMTLLSVDAALGTGWD